MLEATYEEIYNFNNLFLSWQKAKKGKTKKRYVKRFKKNLKENLLHLQKELKNENYNPCRLKNFILRDPKTRKISKSAFRDRVVHHALCNLIVPIFEKDFIYDSHANQIGKGTHKALERFDKFKRKVSKNNTRNCYVLKADIRRYFEEISHKVLIKIVKRRIKDARIINLISKILANHSSKNNDGKGMPLGNLTSQFFANVYLNELDQFVKHELKIKYYIRYVDDFVILDNSRDKLERLKIILDKFLKENLDINLHPNKSRVIKIEKGVSFLGFRIFYYHRLLRKSNFLNFERKFNNMKILFDEDFITREKTLEKLEGWIAYARHGNTYKYRKHLIKNFNKLFPYVKGNGIRNKKKFKRFIKKVKESELEFSTQKTLLLFLKRMSIKEISKHRNVKEDTIWSHLENLIEHKQIPLNKVLSVDKIYKIVTKIYSKKDRLKDIKNRIKDKAITYNEIACVKASIKSKIKNSPS